MSNFATMAAIARDAARIGGDVVTAHKAAIKSSGNNYYTSMEYTIAEGATIAIAVERYGRGTTVAIDLIDAAGCEPGYVDSVLASVMGVVLATGGMDVVAWPHDPAGIPTCRIEGFGIVSRR